MNLDYTTIAFIKHSIAGQLANSRGCVRFLKDGKTTLSTGENILDILARDLKNITDFIVELEKNNS